MKFSREALLVLLQQEGIVLSWYKDSAGVWTVGAGHTEMAGPPKYMGSKERLSIDECIRIFLHDVKKYEAGVLRAVTRKLKQHEFDGLGLWHYNTGAIKSGSVDDKLNAGNVNAALDTLDDYVKAGGKKLPGLVKRRAMEVAMFRDGVYPTVKHVPVYDKYPGKPRQLDVRDIVWPSDGVETPRSTIEPPRPTIEPQGWLARLIETLLAVFLKRK